MAKKKKAKKKKVVTIQEVRKDINPQLCKVYNPTKHNWDRPWIAEPKFDGLRCLVVCECGKPPKAYSRNGKPLWNMEPILKEINETRSHSDSYVLDGEVYTTDWNLSMSIVKRSTQTHPDQDKLRYHVFDCISIDDWKAGKSNVSNVNRKKNLFPFRRPEKHYVEVVEGVIVHDHEELENVYQRFLVEGYEGVVLKDPEGIYECGRKSPYWLKVKPWSDADLKVIGSYPGEGKHTGRIGGLVLEGETEWNGRTYSIKTEVGTGFTDEERDFFQNLSEAGLLVGRTVEIKFQDITVEGACRFPVYSRLREDKE